MSNAIYDTVDKYIVRGICEGPMHVGSGEDRSEVLIHPVDHTPFIQGTSLCGVMRSYCRQIGEEAVVNRLFGDASDDGESKVKFTDARFQVDESLVMELRPRVRINAETGTVASQKTKGNVDVHSGQKFDMQYIGSGARLTFEIYLYGGTQQEEQLIRQALGALQAQEIQIGGQKSTGCGIISLESVEYGHYDMTDKESRRSWIRESGMKKLDLNTLVCENHLKAYIVDVEAETEGELLVKGIAIEDFSREAPKAVNQKNAKGCYIVPGTSVKGAVRNRMEMIREYMHLDVGIIDQAFGREAQEEQEGMTGNLRFYDVIVGDDSREQSNLRTRIRIDKFTGGVMNGGLFTERNVHGKMDMRMMVGIQNDPEATLGLLLLALKDLSCKLYSLGSGQNVGKGYINIRKIRIQDLRQGQECELDERFQLKGQEEVLERCMKALAEKGKGV